MKDRIEIKYATVREYNEFVEDFPEITHQSGDLKNCQRPWVVKEIFDNIKNGRVLEVGADNCELANYLQNKGYEVWVIDPYNGVGGGISRFEEIKKKYPRLKVIKGFLHEDQLLSKNYFDVVYSVSVFEHIPFEYIGPTVDKIFKCLKKGGLSIHAIDFTVLGIMQNHNLLNEIIRCHNIIERAEVLGEKALSDIDTFYLSPIGHYRWRKFLNKSYDEYPFRKVTSLNLMSSKE